MNTKISQIVLLFSIVLIFSCQQPDTFQTWHDALKVKFSGENAQIEIGGPFVGIEMHNSSPLLNRISFYYPRANSIDLNEDYWKREQFRILFLGLKIGDGGKEWLKPEPFEFELTPYSVVFSKTDERKRIDVAYHFCKDKPAMVAQIEITNNSDQALTFELYTHLEATLKTSHSYVHKTAAWTEFEENGSTIYVNFDDPETGIAQIFVANAGEIPQSFTTRNTTGSIPPDGENWWINESSTLPGEIIAQENPARPVSAYVYQKNLAPDAKMQIIQIIGSCLQEEGRETVAYLLENHKQEVEKYENNVLKKAFPESMFETGNPVFDHSVHWAKAILAANAHYLDGEIVPMPCAAEYNFYFTHDALLTDLAAVNFDLARVKNDLRYIVDHADDNKVIPHAYYWKDNRFLTEFAESDNWNHFWFILLAASYLRHSEDTVFIQQLYPYLQTSVEATLSNKREDNLLWAYRPDWWDIGRSEGPRSYMTILAIRALRDFIYLSTATDKNTDSLLKYEEIATKMQIQLEAKLWDEDLKYLINFYEDGSEDQHIYIGSLLAPVFDLLDEAKKLALVETAKNNLLDEKVGIYNVFPMDFHLLTEFLKLKGNEAGAPHVYGNGGIWPHGNAWFALALLSIGEKEEAFRFIKNMMTVQGIMDSPNGQPAMYEYRNSNSEDPAKYGRVDKPQFLWAGGWYLYCLYHLLGVNENEWNISLRPNHFKEIARPQFTLCLNGKPITVTIKGNGSFIRRMKIDGNDFHSAVIPANQSIQEKIEIELGEPEFPYLTAVDALLLAYNFNKYENKFVIELKAFPGHKNKIRFVASQKPKIILQNGIALNKNPELLSNKSQIEFGLIMKQQNPIDTLTVQF